MLSISFQNFKKNYLQNLRIKPFEKEMEKHLA